VAPGCLSALEGLHHRTLHRISPGTFISRKRPADVKGLNKPKVL
jgi:hypothetical protein